MIELIYGFCLYYIDILVLIDKLVLLRSDHNDSYFRILLWHGSRLTNYVGILNQGLRIAPPEAPVTGYMVMDTPVFIAIKPIDMILSER